MPQLFDDTKCRRCKTQERAWPYVHCMECREKNYEYRLRKLREKWAGMTPAEIRAAKAEARAEGKRKAAEKRREELAAAGFKKCPRCWQYMEIYEEISEGKYRKPFYCPECRKWDRERKRRVRGT